MSLLLSQYIFRTKQLILFSNEKKICEYILIVQWGEKTICNWIQLQLICD